MIERFSQNDLTILAGEQAMKIRLLEQEVEIGRIKYEDMEAKLFAADHGNNMLEMTNANLLTERNKYFNRYTNLLKKRAKK